MPTQYGAGNLLGSPGSNDYANVGGTVNPGGRSTTGSTLMKVPQSGGITGGGNYGMMGGQASGGSGNKLPAMPDFSKMFGGSGFRGQGTSGNQPPGGQSPVNYAAGPMNLQAQRDPQLQAMYNAYGTQRAGLAAGNDTDAINAMQRQRDMTSGAMSEAASGAARRGLGANTGVSQYLQSQQAAQGARNNTSLNAAMTSDARTQQLQALSGQTGAAQASSSALQGQQNYALDQWKAQQQAAQAQAQLQAMQQQNAWGNQMGMLNWYSGMMGF